VFCSNELQRINGEHRTRTGTRAGQSDRGGPVCGERCPGRDGGRDGGRRRCVSRSETCARQVCRYVHLIYTDIDTYMYICTNLYGAKNRENESEVQKSARVYAVSSMDDMDRKFFKVLFSPVHCLYSLLSAVKSIHMGSVPGTTTFSSQSATILDASLLLYVVFFDLSTFVLSSLYVFLIDSLYFLYACSVVYFTFCTIAIPTAFNSVACTLGTCFFQQILDTRCSIHTCTNLFTDLFVIQIAVHFENVNMAVHNNKQCLFT